MEPLKYTGRITVIANQKGGVGKTTAALALATGLKRNGHNTLAVDTDPQGNLTYTMNADENAPGVYELMKGTVAPIDAIQRTEQGDVIGGGLALTGVDLEFTDAGREYILREALTPLRAAYDFIIIDTPPTLGVLTINALTAANDIIIPMCADAYSLHGLSQLYAAIGKIRERCNPGLYITGLLITRYSKRTVLSRELKETIESAADRVGASVFNAVIREGIAVKEAQIQQSSIYTASPRNAVTADFTAFVNEYLERIRRHE